MSTIKAGAIVALDGTSPVTLTGQYAVKTWVMYNQQGTQAVLDSLNVSSITDNGSGYTITNFTNSSASLEFMGNGSGEAAPSYPVNVDPSHNTSPAVGAREHYTTNWNSQAAYDSSTVVITYIGDLS